MKSKTSPTSPRAKIKYQNELDKLYHDEGIKKIEKPKNKRQFSIVGLIILSALIGFMAGILGEVVFLSYASDIPVLKKLDMFSYVSQPSLFIAKRSANAEKSVEQIEKYADELASSVVSIYQKKQSTVEIESIYLPSEKLGNGLILTDDGYIVTHVNLGSESEYVVINLSGEIYNIDSAIIDPVTKFNFIKIEAVGLETVAIAQLDSIGVSEEILAINYFAANQPPAVGQTEIIATSINKYPDQSEVVKSSENDYHWIWTNDSLPSLFNESIAFTYDKEALGVIVDSAGKMIIIPFDHISGLIRGVLTAAEIKRPYLGIYYIDLATAINLDPSLTGGKTTGALIFTDDAEAKPSIVEQSPAAKAGLLEGDIITDVDNQPINTLNTLSDLILDNKPGDVINLRIIREGKQIDKKVSLEQFNL